MSHNDLHLIYIIERLQSMESKLQRTVVSSREKDLAPSVCKSCYADYDLVGCPCGRSEWVPLPAAIMQARLILSRAQDSQHEYDHEFTPLVEADARPLPA